MLDEITIVGYPSTIGGANTEMFDQIKVWRTMGIRISVMPTKPIDANQKTLNLERYVNEIYPLQAFYKLKNKNCIAFCNDNALRFLPQITQYSKTFTNVPCMCVPKELEKKYQDLIDLWLFQTNINKQKTIEPLKNKKSLNCMFVTPHFDTTAFPYTPSEKRIKNRFSFGRLSRGDILKWNKHQMWIYDNIQSSRPKFCNVVGWHDSFSQKCGDVRRPWLKAYAANTVDVNSFYRTCNVFCITCDTLENFPRTGFEAMSTGSILVVDDKGGWKEQIRHKETGFLCKNRDEFVNVMNQIEKDPVLEDTIRKNARHCVTSEYGITQSAKSWEKIFDKIEKLASKKRNK